MDGDIATLTGRLERLSASVVSDVLDHCGYPEQSLSSAIHPLDRGMRLAGPALCFAGVSVGEPSPATAGPQLSSFEIDRGVSPGSIVVIATNGHQVSAVVGGLMGLEFRRKGCGGVVVDGGVRDSAELIDLGLPTFCRYVTPLISARRWRLTVVNKAISLPGQASDSVTVEPSDLIVGDADGVLVVPRGIAAQVIAWSEELASIEEKIVGRLKAGEAREAVFAALPRFAHIRPLRG